MLDLAQMQTRTYVCFRVGNFESGKHSPGHCAGVRSRSTLGVEW